MTRSPAFLTLAFVAVRTLSQGSLRMLSAAWGVAVGVFWMTFFSHTEALNTGTEVSCIGAMLSGGSLMLLLGAMLVVSFAGLFLSLSLGTIQELRSRP